MNKNIKVAKELIKLAKQLTAVNPSENISDASYHAMIRREMQEFLEKLDKYLKLRSYFLRAINSNDNEELIKIKGKIANVLKENSEFSNLSTNQLVDDINKFLSQAQDSLNGSTLDGSELSFQRYIGSLIETKKTFLYAKNIGGKSSVQIEDNAKYLMSKIAHILHNQRQLLINTPLQMVTDELAMLYDFLNEKGIQLVTSLSTHAGDKNYADNALIHVNVERAKNNSEFRVRIKKESENLIKFSNLLATFGESLSSNDIKNERFTLVRRIGDSISTCKEMMMGYFTTINTLTLSAMKSNRKSRGLIELDKDISGSESQQYSEIQTIYGINLDKMKEILRNQGASKGWTSIQEDLSKIFDNQSEYDKLTEEQKELLLKELKGLKTKFNKQIGEEKVYLKLIEDFLNKHKDDEIDGWSLLTKNGPSILFDDVNEFEKLNYKQQQLLLKALKKFKTEFREKHKTSSDNNIINAGLIDNVKNFLQSAIDKIKDITFNVKKAFVNFLKKFNTQIDAIEKDLNKLDIIIEEDNKLTKQQINMMKKINEMDQSLINLFNEIKNK